MFDEVVQLWILIYFMKTHVAHKVVANVLRSLNMPAIMHACGHGALSDSLVITSPNGAPLCEQHILAQIIKILYQRNTAFGIRTRSASAHILRSAFIWRETPEGQTYWHTLDSNMSIADMIKKGNARCSAIHLIMSSILYDFPQIIQHYKEKI